MTDTERPNPDRTARSPGIKLLFAMLIATLLSVPLFAVYLLVYDRQSQSSEAQRSIAQGWGGPQTIAGPTLVIPYTRQETETVTENGKAVTRTNIVAHELTLFPAASRLRTRLNPQVRHRSIYDVVVYEAHNTGQARFVLPGDLARSGVDVATLAFDRAQLRFGISDARGLFGAPPAVKLDGRALTLQPGGGAQETNGSGFSAWVDARALIARPVDVAYDYAMRGNATLALLPTGGDTRWQVSSSWPNPSYQGDFLPAARTGDARGFTAEWRVGNLALGSGLTAIDAANDRLPDGSEPGGHGQAGQSRAARVDLVTPVDVYAQVNRSVKYGFLFIGFTFMAFLMFDLIGGVRVSPIEYGLVGAGLVLFFVMLLAFAEVAGFTLAYMTAGGAIIGLLTAYSSAVLRSWRRGGFIATLLVALYGVLYVLLSLEDLSLLIGSLLLFAALAAVMYLTRGIDWGGRGVPADA